LKANQQFQHKEPSIQKEIQNIYAILNKISFGTLYTERAENMDAYLLEVTASSVAGDDNELTHDFKRTPQGYIVISQSGSGDFSEGTGTNSDTTFFVKCSTASTRFKVILV